MEYSTAAMDFEEFTLQKRLEERFARMRFDMILSRMWHRKMPCVAAEELGASHD